MDKACMNNCGGTLQAIYPPDPPPLPNPGGGGNPPPFYGPTMVTLNDPNTNVPVNVVTTYNSAGVPSSIAYNLDGTVYAGNIADLVNDDIEIESSPELFCDNGTTFIRWFQMRNGVPTGVTFDTSQSGGAYVPTNPVMGACATAANQNVFDGLINLNSGQNVVLNTLAPIAAGKKLISYTIHNTGQSDISFTGSDLATGIIPSGMSQEFAAEENQVLDSSVSVNTLTSTATIFYSYV